MYNLLVENNPDSWKTGRHSFSRSRFLEYTEDNLRAQFETIDTRAVATLTSIPALFMYETGGDDGFFGVVTRMDGGPADFEYELLKGYPRVPHSLLSEHAMLFGIERIELNRTHWAVKNIDLQKAFERCGFELPAFDPYGYASQEAEPEGGGGASSRARLLPRSP